MEDRLPAANEVYDSVLGGLPEYMQHNIIKLNEKYSVPLEDIKKVYLMGSDTESILRMMEKDPNMTIELVYSLQKIGLLQIQGGFN